MGLLPHDSEIFVVAQHLQVTGIIFEETLREKRGNRGQNRYQFELYELFYLQFLAIQNFLFDFLNPSITNGHLSYDTPGILRSVSERFHFLQFELIISERERFD